FMQAAFKEQRFGRAAYDREIALARRRYEEARAKGKDAALSGHEVGDAITYRKGALVMDLLRREMGEQAFWAGLRDYTRSHAGGTVRSRDLQVAMERAARRSLEAFFRRAVFGVDPL